MTSFGRGSSGGRSAAAPRRRAACARSVASPQHRPRKVAVSRSTDPGTTGCQHSPRLLRVNKSARSPIANPIHQRRCERAGRFEAGLLPRPPLREGWFANSPLERDGFELLVPVRGERFSRLPAARGPRPWPHNVGHLRRNRGQHSCRLISLIAVGFKRTAVATPSTRTPHHVRCRTQPWRGRGTR